MAKVVVSCLLLATSSAVFAQSGEPEQPLGDLARDVRRNKVKTPAARVVVDNENFANVMQEVESQRQSSFALGFKLAAVPPKPTTPDATCSLAFNAQSVSLTDAFISPAKPTVQNAASAPVSAPVAAPAPNLAEVLPADALAKLEGPAAIVGDSLQVSIYNGTNWELREITVSLTIVHRAKTAAIQMGAGRVVPASSVQIVAKRSDKAVLYHLKGSAAPASTTVFKDVLGMTLDADQEWHWAIVEAKGVPAK